ncbi:MAG TPA: class I SAM-dependent methyltransferase [Kofleriaceae bacterium]|nr:class I SAM-dependent methyltransferase [Kofleriaceae bacterium]
MEPRDFSTIGPSARMLLVMRAQSDLPFARQSAELLLGAERVAQDIARLAELAGSALRLRHFVARYRSIDTLLAESGAIRVLELGGGLSLRGLAWAERNAGTYLDTDLPDMVRTKQQLMDALAVGPLVGELRLAALNALDADAFRASVATLPAGPIAIVNEGLLMYLDDAEKQQLATNIRDALSARGGVWITADIYVQGERSARIERSEREREFLAAHRVEENKFASLTAAESFFTGAGFTIVRRLPSDVTRESWVVEAR